MRVQIDAINTNAHDCDVDINERLITHLRLLFDDFDVIETNDDEIIINASFNQ